MSVLCCVLCCTSALCACLPFLLLFGAFLVLSHPIRCSRHGFLKLRDNTDYKTGTCMTSISMTMFLIAFYGVDFFVCDRFLHVLHRAFAGRCFVSCLILF